MSQVGVEVLKGERGVPLGGWHVRPEPGTLMQVQYIRDGRVTNQPTVDVRQSCLLTLFARDPPNTVQELFISLRGGYVWKRQPKRSSCTVSRYHDMHARARCRCRDEAFQAGVTMPFQKKPEARVLDPHMDTIKLPASAVSAVPRPLPVSESPESSRNVYKTTKARVGRGLSRNPTTGITVPITVPNCTQHTKYYGVEFSARRPRPWHRIPQPSGVSQIEYHFFNF